MFCRNHFFPLVCFIGVRNLIGIESSEKFINYEIKNLCIAIITTTSNKVSRTEKFPKVGI